jgi:hypothetical protein
MSEHNDSASPEQHESDFAEGERVIPETPLEKEAEEGRFSKGQETFPNSPEKHVNERFSEGQELLPDSPQKEHEGSFAEGQETLDPTHGPGTGTGGTGTD